MKKEIKTFEAYLEGSLLQDNSIGNEEKAGILVEYMHILQHERLIHLVVLMATLFSFIMSVVLLFYLPSLLSILLSGILFLLLGGYLFHYYYLENHVQSSYLVYLDILKKKHPSS